MVQQTESQAFKSTNPTITLLMRAVQAHVMMGQAHAAKDPGEKAKLLIRASTIRASIGAAAYSHALLLVARTGPAAQQAQGWARVAIRQLGLKGSFRFGDAVIEVK